MKDSAYESFSESAQDALDFARCQRPDGSFYGTGGQCRKGTSVGPKEKAALKKAAKAGNKKAQKALDKLDGKPDKKAMAEADTQQKEMMTLAEESRDESYNIILDTARELEEGDISDKEADKIIGKHYADMVRQDLEGGGDSISATDVVTEAIFDSPGRYREDNYEIATGENYNSQLNLLRGKYKKAGLSDSEIEDKIDDIDQAFN